MNVMWPRRWLFMDIFLPYGVKNWEYFMWTYMVHVKVTASRPYGKRQIKASHGWSQSISLFICLAVAVRLVWGVHAVLCFMRCVYQYLWCMWTSNNVPHYNIIPFSLEIHIHERGTRKIFMGCYSFFFRRMGMSRKIADLLCFVAFMCYILF